VWAVSGSGDGVGLLYVGVIMCYGSGRCLPTTRPLVQLASLSYACLLPSKEEEEEEERQEGQEEATSLISVRLIPSNGVAGVCVCVCVCVCACVATVRCSLAPLRPPFPFPFPPSRSRRSALTRLFLLCLSLSPCAAPLLFLRLHASLSRARVCVQGQG
jgi:hypothetical protein